VRWPALRSVAQCPHGLGVAAVVVVSLIGAAPAFARTTTALEVRAAGAPQAVFGSDGRERVEYDLVVTNVFSADATLESLAVRGDGRRLLTLSGDALAAVTRKLFTEEPTVTVPAATTAYIQVSLVLPRSYGRTAPHRLTKPMRYLFLTRSSCKTASDPWSRGPISRGPCLNRDGAEHQAQRSRRERERVGARPPVAGTHACRHRQAFRGRPPAAAAVSYGNNPAASGVWPPEGVHSHRLAVPWSRRMCEAAMRAVDWVVAMPAGLIAARRRSGHASCA
jgi:hypothetical protein